MIAVNDFLDYVDKLQINPINAINMATRHYHRGVLSLPTYLKVRGILENGEKWRSEQKREHDNHTSGQSRKR